MVVVVAGVVQMGMGVDQHRRIVTWRCRAEKVDSAYRIEIEEARVKEQAIKSATEAASMILRVDDVIAAAKPPPAPPSRGGEEY